MNHPIPRNKTDVNRTIQLGVMKFCFGTNMYIRVMCLTSLAISLLPLCSITAWCINHLTLDPSQCGRYRPSGSFVAMLPDHLNTITLQLWNIHRCIMIRNILYSYEKSIRLLKLEKKGFTHHFTIKITNTKSYNNKISVTVV